MTQASTPPNTDDIWDDAPPPTSEEVYKALLRALRRTRGFGILFVECSPAEGQRIIQRIRDDLPTKTIGELVFKDAIEDGNVYGRVKQALSDNPVNILFIQGLEYSLYDYEDTKRHLGWTSEETYGYSWKGVPRVMINLNQQRENFRDSFENTCLVFLVPVFVKRYFIHRAPDFFDWRSDVFKFPLDKTRLQQETKLAYVDERTEQAFKTLTPSERRNKILQIQSLLDESKLNTHEKASLHYEQALLFGVAGELEAAIASYDKAIECKPDVHQAWYNRGVALSDLGRKEEAIASYDKAIEVKPDYHEAWYNRRIALSGLGRKEEAIQGYDKALKNKSDMHQAWYGGGLALSDLGRKEEAIASYDKAIEIKPDMHEAWYDRGLALSDLGRKEEAIASYDKAIEVKPDYHEAWGCRGIALTDLQRYAEAIFSYNKVLIINPDNSYAYYKKACCYALWGKILGSIESLKMAINIDANYREKAKTDSDFDGIRDDERFQALLAGTVAETN